MGVTFVLAITELGTKIIMKILLVIALFAAVQAKPYFYYGLPHVPVVHYAHEVVKVEPPNICKNEAGEEVECALKNAPYYTLGALKPVALGKKKREAEAEPEAEAEAEADPWLLYSGYYGHPGYYGYGYGLGYGWGGYYGLGYYGGCRNNLGALVPCAGK